MLDARSDLDRYVNTKRLGLFLAVPILLLGFFLMWKFRDAARGAWDQILFEIGSACMATAFFGLIFLIAVSLLKEYLASEKKDVHDALHGLEKIIDEMADRISTLTIQLDLDTLKHDVGRVHFECSSIRSEMALIASALNTLEREALDNLLARIRQSVAKAHALREDEKVRADSANLESE